MQNELIFNLERIHTTEMGIIRIKKNLLIDINDIVEWCKTIIANPDSVITRKGKNWYISTEYCTITVNCSSYTIITAHAKKANYNGSRGENNLKNKSVKAKL